MTESEDKPRKGQKYTAGIMIAAIHEARGMVYVAARKLGCSPRTVYNYAKNYKSVQAAIDDERGVMIDNAELVLWDAIQARKPWAVSLTLKTIGKHRGYVERQEVTGADGGPVVVVNWEDDAADTA